MEIREILFSQIFKETFKVGNIKTPMSKYNIISDLLYFFKDNKITEITLQ